MTSQSNIIHFNNYLLVKNVFKQALKLPAFSNDFKQQSAAQELSGDIDQHEGKHQQAHREGEGNSLLLDSKSGTINLLVLSLIHQLFIVFS